MKLSIITVNYNNLEGFRKTAESVVAQTFRDYEWIIIDGGSTDGSRELIEQYAEHIAYWVSEPDKGIYNAMNKGLRQAKGDWLQFLNSGDELSEATILEEVFALPMEGDVMYGDNYCTLDGKVVGKKVYPEEISLYYFYLCTINHQAAFYRRDVFEGLEYDERFRISADIALNCSLVYRNKRFVHIPLFVVRYDISGISSEKQQAQNLQGQDLSLLWKEYFPYHVRLDMESRHKHNLLFHQRRTIDWMYRHFYKLCVRLDRLFGKIEKRRAGRPDPQPRDCHPDCRLGPGAARLHSQHYRHD